MANIQAQLTIPGIPAGDPRHDSIQRCLANLIHACHCDVVVNCTELSCRKMKKVVQHTKVCRKRRIGASCRLCKQLIALCYHHHAKQCIGYPCPVPWCLNIRLKLQEQKRQKRREMRRPLQMSTKENAGNGDSG